METLTNPNQPLIIEAPEAQAAQEANTQLAQQIAQMPEYQPPTEAIDGGGSSVPVGQLAESETTDIKETEVTNDIPETQESIKTPSRIRKIGKFVLARGATEVAGIGIDAVTMGGGKAGIELLQNVGVREGIGSLGDNFLFRWLNRNRDGKGEKTQESESESLDTESEVTSETQDRFVLDQSNEVETKEKTKVPRKWVKKLGHLAITMATAIAAQKLGPGIVEHVAANLNHGIGEFAIPLGSKVGATTAVGAMLNKKG